LHLLREANRRSRFELEVLCCAVLCIITQLTPVTAPVFSLLHENDNHITSHCILENQANQSPYARRVLPNPIHTSATWMQLLSCNTSAKAISPPRA